MVVVELIATRIKSNYIIGCLSCYWPIKTHRRLNLIKKCLMRVYHVKNVHAHI